MPDNSNNERWDNERWDDRPGVRDRRWEQFRDVPPARRRQYRRSHWHHAPASRLLIAIVLIGAGTLLFLSNLGLLPEFNLWDFWPLIFVVAGIVKLVGERCATGRAIGLIMIAGGTLFLLVTLGVLHVRAHDDSWPISLLLLAAGSIALIKVLESNERGRPRVGFPQETPAPSASLDVLDQHVVLGAVKRKVESNDFRGGKLDCILGGIDLNLRRANISSVERSATIELNVVFGAVELRVPETWRVVIQAAQVFSSIEDKTVANKSPGFDGPALFIVGSVVFGSVEIKD
jgi:hypothetical protein